MHELFRGQQVTFPMRIHLKSYVIEELNNISTVSDIKYLARKLGYSERWIRMLIKKIERSKSNE